MSRPNLPNSLTIIRLIGIPALIVLLACDARIAAAIVFVLASLTDLADGALARSRGQVTAFGTLADPIADKLLTGTALIGLSWMGQLAWWITVVILVREVGVTILRFVVIRHGVIPASRGGKAKTLVQTVAITMYLLPLTGWAVTLSQYVMGLALVLTVITGIDYVAQAARLPRGSARGR